MSLAMLDRSFIYEPVVMLDGAETRQKLRQVLALAKNRPELRDRVKKELPDYAEMWRGNVFASEAATVARLFDEVRPLITAKRKPPPLSPITAATERVLDGYAALVAEGVEPRDMPARLGLTWAALEGRIRRARDNKDPRAMPWNGRGPSIIGGQA